MWLPGYVVIIKDRRPTGRGNLFFVIPAKPVLSKVEGAGIQIVGWALAHRILLAAAISHLALHFTRRLCSP